MIVVADMDMYHSTELASQVADDAVQQTYAAWHGFVDELMGPYGGQQWNRSADRIHYIFDHPDQAISGCIRLLEDEHSGMPAFNSGVQNMLRGPIYLRIGVTIADSTDLRSIPQDERSIGGFPVLGELAELQKACPTGSLAISRGLFEAIGSQQMMFRRPSSPKLIARHAHVWLGRQRVLRQDELLGKLTPSERRAIPIISFTDWDQLRPDRNVGLRNLEELLAGPGRLGDRSGAGVLVVLGDTLRLPEDSLEPAHTSDSVGIMESVASWRITRDVVCGLDRWEGTAELATQRHVIMVGSGVVNGYAYALNDLFRPARFDRHEGDVNPTIVTMESAADVRIRRRFSAHTKRGGRPVRACPVRC